MKQIVLPLSDGLYRVTLGTDKEPSLGMIKVIKELRGWNLRDSKDFYDAQSDKLNIEMIGRLYSKNIAEATTFAERYGVTMIFEKLHD